MIQASVKIVLPMEKRDELLDVLRCLSGPTEVARGCHRCRILHDCDDEGAITYLVQWDSQCQLEDFFRSERFRRLMPYIELSMQPPEIEISTVEPIGGIEFLVAAIGSTVH